MRHMIKAVKHHKYFGTCCKSEFSNWHVARNSIPHKYLYNCFLKPDSWGRISSKWLKMEMRVRARATVRLKSGGNRSLGSYRHILLKTALVSSSAAPKVPLQELAVTEFMLGGESFFQPYAPSLQGFNEASSTAKLCLKKTKELFTTDDLCFLSKDTFGWERAKQVLPSLLKWSQVCTEQLTDPLLPMACLQTARLFQLYVKDETKACL